MSRSIAGRHATLLLHCIILLAKRRESHYVAMQQMTQEAMLATPSKAKSRKPAAKSAPVAAQPVVAKVAAKPAPAARVKPVAAPEVIAPVAEVRPAPAAVASPVVTAPVVTATPADALAVEWPVAAPAGTTPRTTPRTTPMSDPVSEPEILIPTPVLAHADLSEAVAELTKGKTTMTDVLETAKSYAEEAKTRFQSAFVEVNEKTKAAVEKSSKAFEEIGELTKGNLEAVVESSKIAAKGVESLGQDAAEFGRKSFEKTSATLKSFAAVKTPAEFFQLHSDLLSATLDSFASEASKNSEAFLKLAGDISAPISNRVSVVTEKLKSLAA